jgi:aminopeptidase 2
MRRFSSRVLLQQAKPPLLSARAPLPLFVSRSPQAPVPRSITRRTTSPLLQTSKRYCSYRRMCGTRRGEASGSTNVQGREVLPTNVKPQHYDLTLEPNFEKFTYEGTVTIEYAIA